MDELDELLELAQSMRGLLIGDEGYISAPLHEELLSQAIDLQTASRENMKDDRDPRFVMLIASVRR